MPDSIPNITTINIRRQSRLLSLEYDNGEKHEIPFELLRVYSPSAEVKGYGPGQEVLQVGKADVLINGINTVGNYAIQILFNDGHDSGIYSWSYLYELASNHEALFQDYLQRLEAAGKSRFSDKPSLGVVSTFDPGKSQH